MIITKAKINDIKDIMIIINEAKKYLNDQHINQWQDGYPNEDVFLDDIFNDRLYVVKKNNNIIGVFALINYEPTYDIIYEGNWLNNDKYVAVHRIAVLNKYKGKGIAKYIFDYLKKKYKHLRVDTHELNKNMQRCLLKNNFKYCGIIYLNKTESDNKRLAYEYFV